MSKRFKTYLEISIVSIISLIIMYLVNVPRALYFAIGFVIIFNIIIFEYRQRKNSNS